MKNILILSIFIIALALSYGVVNQANAYTYYDANGDIITGFNNCINAYDASGNPVWACPPGYSNNDVIINPGYGYHHPYGARSVRGQSRRVSRRTSRRVSHRH